MTRLTAPYCYPPLRRVLHWATVPAVALAFIAIWTREATDDTALRALLMQLHRVAGLLVLALTLARLIARLRDGAAPPTPDVSPTMARLADLAHGLIYALLCAQPLLGWAYLSARGRTFDLFGLATVPPLFERVDAWVDPLNLAHAAAGWALGVLLALHLAALPYHAFVLRHAPLARMWPRRDAA